MFLGIRVRTANSALTISMIILGIVVISVLLAVIVFACLQKIGSKVIHDIDIEDASLADESQGLDDDGQNARQLNRNRVQQLVLGFHDMVVETVQSSRSGQIVGGG